MKRKRRCSELACVSSRPSSTPIGVSATVCSDSALRACWQQSNGARYTTMLATIRIAPDSPAFLYSHAFHLIWLIAFRLAIADPQPQQTSFHGGVQRARPPGADYPCRHPRAGDATLPGLSSIFAGGCHGYSD